VLDPSRPRLPDLDRAEASTLHHDVIRRNEAADNRFTQASGGVDHALIARAGDRIGGEHDAGGVRGHHTLHHHRQGYRLAGEAALLPVADGAVRPERAPALPNGLEEGNLVPDTQKCVLLAGEGRAG
jgi:hypothetical protein